MPVGQVTQVISADSESIFDLIHDYDRRLEWDSFLREACLLDGAVSADKGVSSRCVARWGAGGLAMDTVYVTFSRPNVAAVKMTKGPFFLKAFAATIRQSICDEANTIVVYKYNFEVQPAPLAWMIAPIVSRIFRQETENRLSALKEFLESAS